MSNECAGLRGELKRKLAAKRPVLTGLLGALFCLADGVSGQTVGRLRKSINPAVFDTECVKDELNAMDGITDSERCHGNQKQDWEGKGIGKRLG